MRRRDLREFQARKFLMERGCASAFDLGTAAVAGEPKLHAKARAGIGLALGVHFVQLGIAQVTRFNQFEWVPST
ncbi:hypothetical protein [Mesorhizobium sp. WSM2561]|uniref:hypothetical protein n=1 Tax=Mesorhizobium sp. WSM2561 TaxID=1040985 RepID=UPI0012EB6861|nr:hypothetical protein [Mesorhizobium sp. WSM2561]